MSYAAKEDVFEGDRRHREESVFEEVAYISVRKTKGWTRGTGFLVKVEGQCILLTAAHCLYDENVKDVAKHVEIYFGRRSQHERPSVEKVLENIYVHPHYRPDHGEDSEQDLGFIYLGSKEDFPHHGGFKLVVLDLDELTKSKETFITGYPAEISWEECDQFQQYSVRLTNIRCHPQRRFLTYKDATSGGMSGSPLYFRSPLGHFAFGIHVNAENGAVWLTKDEIALIENAVLRVAAGQTVGWQHHETNQYAKESCYDGVREKVSKLALFNPNNPDDVTRWRRPRDCVPISPSTDLCTRSVESSPRRCVDTSSRYTDSYARAPERSPRSAERFTKSSTRSSRSSARSSRSATRSSRSPDPFTRSGDSSTRFADYLPKSKDYSSRSSDCSPSYADRSPGSLDRSGDYPLAMTDQHLRSPNLTPRPDDIPSASRDVFYLNLTFDSEKVERTRHINTEGELVNSSGGRPNIKTSGRFQRYCGTTTTNPIPCTNCALYTELVTYIEIVEPLEGKELLLETGICLEEDVDVYHQIPGRQSCHKLMVTRCQQHALLCIRVYSRGRVIHHLPGVLSNTAGSRSVLHLGIVFDACSSKMAYIDVNRMETIAVVSKVDYTQSVWPMFGLYSKEKAAIRMKLLLDHDIDMTQKKTDMLLASLM